MQRAALAGIPIPTTLVQNGKDPVGAWINVSRGKWRDCVAKLPVGSHGAGVQVCFSKDVLRGFGRLVKVMNPKQPILIQDRVGIQGDDIFDIRVILIGGRVIGAMKRVAEPGFHNANISSGAHGEPYVLTPQMIEISERMCSVLELQIAGVDLLVDGDNKLWCIEANSAPGYRGFDQYCKANIAREIANYVGSLLFTKH
jgi:gamma-F420-2:alpha-L-glutamate ligase